MYAVKVKEGHVRGRTKRGDLETAHCVRHTGEGHTVA